MNRESPTPAAGSVLVYDRIAANKRTTWVLFAVFFLLIGGLATLIILGFQLPFGVLGVMGVVLIFYALFSYFGSTQVVLSVSGAHEVTKEEEWEFVRRVENLSIGAGLPMPRTWVLEDSAPRTPSPPARTRRARTWS